jgi:hypothetical protein
MTRSLTTRLLTAPVALALVLVMSALASAHASSTTQKDPRDDVFLASVGGGIDLAAVRLATLDPSKRIRVTFTLHAAVALEGSLEQPGGMSVEFIRSERILRVVTIDTKDGALRGRVCSSSTGTTPVKPDCSRLPVTRVDATTYRTVVGRGQLRRGAEVLRWTASSMDLSQGQPVSDQLTAANRQPFRWRL